MTIPPMFIMGQLLVIGVNGPFIISYISNCDEWKIKQNQYKGCKVLLQKQHTQLKNSYRGKTNSQQNQLRKKTTKTTESITELQSVQNMLGELFLYTDRTLFMNDYVL